MGCTARSSWGVMALASSLFTDMSQMRDPFSLELPELLMAMM